MNKIGIIGCGNMGSAIASRLIEQFGGENIYVCDRHKGNLDKLGADNVFLIADTKGSVATDT